MYIEWSFDPFHTFRISHEHAARSIHRTAGKNILVRKDQSQKHFALLSIFYLIMALGMKDPSAWGPNQKFHKEVTRKTLTPTRTWDVKSGFTDRALSIEQDKDVVYTTQSHFTVKKDPYVTLQSGDSETVVAGAKLDGKDSYHIRLGDPAADSSGVDGQECEVIHGGSARAFERRFSPPGEQKDYSWRDTDQREITIGDTGVETTGRDWKLISLDLKGEEDELLAVYINNPKASLRHKSQISWFEEVSGEVEVWAMAALVGLVERRRKSKDKWNFTTMVGAGAVM